ATDLHRPPREVRVVNIGPVHETVNPLGCKPLQGVDLVRTALLITLLRLLPGLAFLGRLTLSRCFRPELRHPPGAGADAPGSVVEIGPVGEAATRVGAAGEVLLAQQLHALPGNVVKVAD